MKKLGFICAFICSMLSQADAGDFKAGKYNLYNEPGMQPSAKCHDTIEFTIDRAEVTGPVAFLTNGVSHGCGEVFALPDFRAYALVEDKDAKASCGSRAYKSTNAGNWRRTTLTVVDHRSRVCEDGRPGLIVTEEVTDLKTGETAKHVFRLAGVHGDN